MNLIVLGHQNLIQLSRSKLYNYFLQHLSSYLSQPMGNHYSNIVVDNVDRAKKIVEMFECQTNWRQIFNILSNPISPVTISHYDNYYRFGIEYLIDSNFFPSEQDRHETLSMKIGIDPCWFVGIDYNNIIYGDLKAHFSDLDLDVEESIAMLTSI